MGGSITGGSTVHSFLVDLHSVSDDERNAALSWKFTVYDKNEDSVLNRVEEFVFHEDLASLFGCSKFFGHLNELMDGNDDHVISPQEWKEFFGVVTSSGM